MLGMRRSQHGSAQGLLSFWRHCRTDGERHSSLNRACICEPQVRLRYRRNFLELSTDTSFEALVVVYAEDAVSVLRDQRLDPLPYTERREDGTSEDASAKNCFHFAPGLVLLGNAADVDAVQF